MLRISFTGHRPNKLGGYDWNSPKNQLIMRKLKQQVIELINQTEENTFNFICGGALGIDQMAFDIVNDLRNNYISPKDLKITIEVAIPFSKQSCKWQYDDVKRYDIQKSQADKCTYVDRLDDYKIKGYEEENYYPAKMQKRNEYMVNNTDITIGVWDGTKGGTGNCINYVKKKGKKIIIINPNEC